MSKRFSYFGSYINNPNLLLNDYPGAVAAYDLRLINNVYLGDCIEVRRSTDGATQDIGFSSGVLDVAAMLTFCGAGDGFVSKWYDQSGNNRDAVQATSANQPKIVSSGVALTTNGNVTIDFEPKTSPYFLEITGLLSSATAFSFFGVWNITDFASSNAGAFAPSLTNSTGLEFNQHTVIGKRTYLRINGVVKNNNAAAAYQLWDDATQSLTTAFGDASTTEAYKNGAAVTLTSSGGVGTFPTLTYAIGRYNAGNYAYLNAQSIILYDSNQTANRAGIETNINNYYSIY